MENTRNNQRLLLLATLISSFGTGADTLLIGKILYDATGSVAAFESVFVVQYFFGALSTVLLAPALDRGRPRRAVMIVDGTRASLLLILAIGVTAHVPAGFLVFPVYGLKLGSQIYQIAMFALVPKTVERQKLLGFTARNSGVMQAALLMGAASVGFMLEVFPPIVVILLDAMTFVASVISVSLVSYMASTRLPQLGGIPTVSTAGATGWRQTLRVIRPERGFLILVFLSAFPAIGVSLINVWLAPIVAQRFHDIPLYLSLFDSAFALGAIAAAFFITKHRGVDRFAAFPFFGQSAAFFVIAVVGDRFTMSIAFFVLGASASTSSVYFTTRLQLWGAEENRAKIFGVRNVVVCAIAVCLIPLFGSLTNLRLGLGIASFSALLSVCGLLLFILPRLPSNRHVAFYDPRHAAQVAAVDGYGSPSKI